MSQSVYDTLEARGFLYQVTDPEAVRRLLGEEKLTFYVGFDPTATSLHVGNLVPIMGMVHLQKAGHRPLAVVGGATGLVGDPSGKTEARPVSDAESIRANAEGLRRQLGRYLEFGEGKAVLLDNADWLCRFGLVDFLREYGRLVSVNRMLSMESVKARLETGITYLEFSYMLLQAFDFYLLARDHGCVLQMGGQDQWGNIVMGIDLIRRLLGRPAYGMTFPLLTNAAGEKFGKSVDGAIWIEKELVTPYHFFQFWRNTDDRDVARLLKMFTLLPVEECDELPRQSINRAKEILAFEATRMTHGEALAREAYGDAVREFGQADAMGEVKTSSRIADADERLKESGDDPGRGAPTTAIPDTELAQGVRLVDLLRRAALTSSGGEARRLIQQGGAYVNEERISDVDHVLTREDLRQGEILVRAGKKKRHRFTTG
jgi:tyrosyl-tRNA synthetase